MFAKAKSRLIVLAMLVPLSVVRTIAQDTPAAAGNPASSSAQAASPAPDSEEAATASLAKAVQNPVASSEQHRLRLRTV
jgi:hypothetical protein